MPYVAVNYWAVLVAGLAAMVVGFLWYGPLFGKMWMKLSGHQGSEKMKQKMTQGYVLMFITTLITACVLKHFITYAGATTWWLGVQGAFWAWLGFIAPVQYGSVLWEGKSNKLFVLNTLHSLISLMIMAAILVSWA